jgi:hypothetical protein
MATTHVAFDTRSGRIICAYLGNRDPGTHNHLAHRHATQPQATIEKEYVELIAVPADAMESGKQYKVDLRSKSLLPISAGESGVSFGFGVSARFGSTPPRSN